MFKHQKGISKLVVVLIIAIVTLVIIGLLIGGYMTWRYFEEKEETERKERREEKKEEEIEDSSDKPLEEEPQSSDNIGVKLSPELTEPDDPDEGVDSQSIYFDELSIAAGQTWNKDTQLKFCIRYKSNVASPGHRSAILGGKSSLGDKYTFQIDLFEYGKDYHCGSYGVGMAGEEGRGYGIVVRLNNSPSNKDIFHEVCIDDINSVLDNCVSEWGIDKNDAYLTDIYIAVVISPDEMSLDEYAIFDYYRIFVDGIQVSESVFPNQDFNKFSGTIDDGQPDDFVEWTEYSDAYAVSVEQD